MHDAHGEQRIKADSFCPAIFSTVLKFFFRYNYFACIFARPELLLTEPKPAYMLFCTMQTKLQNKLFGRYFRSCTSFPQRAICPAGIRPNVTPVMSYRCLYWRDFVEEEDVHEQLYPQFSYRENINLMKKAIDTIRVECCITAEAIFFPNKRNIRP